MENELVKVTTQLIRDKGASGVVDLLSSRATRHSDIANALMRMGSREASEMMAELPPVTQVNLVRASSGPGDVPLIVFVAPSKAPTFVMADSLMCFHRKSGMSWSEAIRLQLEGSLEELKADRQRRTVEVAMPDGEKRAVPVELDPNQALSYLSSILAMADEEARDAILEGLGPEFLAYVLCCVRAGELDVDDDDFAGMLGACPEEFYSIARDMQDLGREAVESDLLDAHCMALAALFGEAVSTEIAGEELSARALEDEIRV